MKPKLAPELVRRWNDGWEAWELPADSTPVLLGQAAERSPKERILAVPARTVIAVPLRVDSHEAEVVDTSLELELEVRGLISRKHSPDFVAHRTKLHGGTQVLCAVFPPEVTGPWPSGKFSRYEASPLLVDAVEDGITIWREGTDLVALFTRERMAMYWATCDWPVDSAGVTCWLKLLLAQLVAAGTLDSAPRNLRIDASLKDNLAGLLSGMTEEYAQIAPSLDRAGFKWKPAATRERERKSVSAQKIRKVALALAASWVLLATLAGLHLGWLSFQKHKLQGEISALEAETDEFQPSVREWRLVGPTANTEYFPIEILHRVVRNMPSSGVRLTVYDLTEENITVQGEATSASLASQFFGALSKDEELTELNWQMPTPSLQPNNAARFQLSGVIP